MTLRKLWWGATSLALMLAVVCCDDETEPSNTVTGSGTQTGSGATTGSGTTTGTGNGLTWCNERPAKATCGSDHAPDENCGPCVHEGLFCDFSDTCSGPGDTILELGCTCTSGSWICNSSDGECGGFGGFGGSGGIGGQGGATGGQGGTGG